MNEEAPDHLIRLFNQGNHRAFDAIYEMYFTAIYYFTRQLIGRKQEAEDIVSEAFFKLWTRRGNFANLEKIKSFLYISAKNDCLDYLRHEKIKSAREEEIINLLSMQREGSLSGEKITAELHNLIYAAIDKLPGKCREIFKLCYIAGFTNEETARRLHISVKTVSNQKLLALRKLRLALR